MDLRPWAERDRSPCPWAPSAETFFLGCLAPGVKAKAGVAWGERIEVTTTAPAQTCMIDDRIVSGSFHFFFLSRSVGLSFSCDFD